MTGRKFDSEKDQYTLIPPFALREIARNLTFGARKYEPENWKKVPNAKKRYLDALFRHVEAYRMGEVNDPENGYHHLAAAAVNLMFVMEFELAKIPEVLEQKPEEVEQAMKQMINSHSMFGDYVSDARLISKRYSDDDYFTT